MEQISREQAISAGLVKYLTGEPCRRGHTASRYTLTGACSECQLEYSRKQYSAVKAKLEAARKPKLIAAVQQGIERLRQVELANAIDAELKRRGSL